jgi:hypothetical protein
MTEVTGRNEPDPIEQIVRAAQREVTLGDGARERVLAAVRAEPRPQAAGSIVRLSEWVREQRVWSASPLRAAAIAAGLVGIGVLGGQFVPESGRAGQLIGQGSPVASSTSTHPVSDSGRTKTFVLVDPAAKQVVLVGGFNGWDKTATPMVKAEGGGVWKVSVPLTAGRHEYSFVVNPGTNEEWRPDPAVPHTSDDGFGRANSVIIMPAPQ